MAGNSDPKYFTAWDYVVCITMLMTSLIIGVISACFDRRRRQRQRTTFERFLIGGRNQSIVPVSLSMTISFTAAINILGTPVDVYVYNTMFWWICLAFLVGGVLVCRIFVPLYFELGINSTFQYLELRFDRKLRVFCTLLFLVQMMIYLGVVLYAPALVLKTVTGFHLWASLGVVCTVAVIYTALGGMDAVVWSDVIQILVILLGLLAAIIMGSNQVGGIGEVWRIARQGDRFKLAVVSFDPTVRHTVWSVMVGMTVIVVATSGTNQVIVQKYVSLGSATRAKMAIILASVLKIVMTTLCVMLGLVVYAAYRLCDPYANRKISRLDQLTPYFVMDLFSNAPGLPGLFVSAILAASMSSLSSGITSMSAVTGECFIKAFWPSISANRYEMVLRILVIFYGSISLGFAALAENIQQGILPLTLSVFGVVGGITLGVFTLGVFFHRSNAKGTLIGAVISLILVTWVKLGTTVSSESLYDGNHMAECLPYNATTAADDAVAMTETAGVILMTTVEPQRRRFLAGLYRLSYQYYAPMGITLTVAFGMIASGITGFNNPDTVDRKLKLYVVDALLCCLPSCLKDLVRRDGQHKRYDYDKNLQTVDKEKKQETSEALEEGEPLTENGQVSQPQSGSEPQPESDTEPQSRLGPELISESDTEPQPRSGSEPREKYKKTTWL